MSELLRRAQSKILEWFRQRGLCSLTFGLWNLFIADCLNGILQEGPEGIASEAAFWTVALAFLGGAVLGSIFAPWLDRSSLRSRFLLGLPIGVILTLWTALLFVSALGFQARATLSIEDVWFFPAMVLGGPFFLWWVILLTPLVAVVYGMITRRGNAGSDLESM